MLLAEAWRGPTAARRGLPRRGWRSPRESARPRRRRRGPVRPSPAGGVPHGCSRRSPPVRASTHPPPRTGGLRAEMLFQKMRPVVLHSSGVSVPMSKRRLENRIARPDHAHGARGEVDGAESPRRPEAHPPLGRVAHAACSSAPPRIPTGTPAARWRHLHARRGARGPSHRSAGSGCGRSRARGRGRGSSGRAPPRRRSSGR